jgi:hypothetical protein
MPVPLVFEATGGDARFTIAAGESTTYPFRRDPGPATNSGYGGAPYLGLTIEAPRSDRLMIEVAEHPRKASLPNDPTLMGAAMPGTRCRSSRPPWSTFRRAALAWRCPGWLRAAASGALRLPG